MRNVSPEDVNRSGLGRMAGGVALLWLASYAIGIPFKYGLAGALLAISALLFAEWDQGNRARRARVRGGTVVSHLRHLGAHFRPGSPNTRQVEMHYTIECKNSAVFYSEGLKCGLWQVAIWVSSGSHRWLVAHPSAMSSHAP